MLVITAFSPLLLWNSFELIKITMCDGLDSSISPNPKWPVSTNIISIAKLVTWIVESSFLQKHTFFTLYRCSDEYFVLQITLQGMIICSNYIGVAHDNSTNSQQRDTIRSLQNGFAGCCLWGRSHLKPIWGNRIVDAIWFHSVVSFEKNG